MECGCQPVAFISSGRVAPLGRFSSSKTFDVLLALRELPVSRAGFGLLEAFLSRGLVWRVTSESLYGQKSKALMVQGVMDARNEG